MTEEKFRETYVSLLMEAEKAGGRKEAVRLIHKADKIRLKQNRERSEQ